MFAELHEMPQVSSHAASNRTAAMECQQCPYRFKGCRDFQQAVEEARCQRQPALYQRVLRQCCQQGDRRPHSAPTCQRLRHLGHTQMHRYAHALPKLIHEGVADTASRLMLAD